MAANTIVRARIREDLKNEATAVLDKFGLTVSDVIRITLTRVAHEKRLPFSEVPNAETRVAMAELDAGGGTRCENAEDLFKDLGI